ALSASSNPGVQGTDVTFTAVVSGSPSWQGWHAWHGWPWWFGGHQQSSSSTPPTGTVNFTIDGGTPVTGTLVGTSGGKAIYAFTTSTLTAVSHTVTASYSGDTNYGASSSHTLTEQIVAATAGSVTAGSDSSPLTLRGGETTFSVNVTQDPANSPIASGT